MTVATPKYYVLGCSSDDMMLLYPPPDPSFEDSWWGGRRFEEHPAEPVVALIQPGNENAELLPFFGTANLMSEGFYKALLAAGVDNIDAYDAVIRSEDGSVEHRGYKAFNVLGLVGAADPKRTVFNPGSKLVDASIDNLAIDPAKAKGLLMFRLAEYVGAVIVHEQVKAAVEPKKYPHVIFRDPGGFFS